MFITFGPMSLSGALKIYLKKTRFFAFVYLAFLCCVLFFVLNYSKLESIVLINGTWTTFQDKFFTLVTYLGGGEVALFLVLVIILFISIRKGLITFFCFSFTALVTQFLKQVIYAETMRPYIALWNEFNNGELHLALPVELMKKGNSFPSGHTTSAFSLFLILTLFVKKPIYGLLFALLASMASYSRVYLGQHFFEDVLLGSAIGFVGTLFLYIYLEQKKIFSKLDISLINYFKNAKKSL